MTRAVTIIGLVLTILIGTGTYWVSHQVERLEKRYADIQSDILAEQESIHVLQAEWSYLNNPERIERLSKQYLSLAQIDLLQMASIDDLSDDADLHQYRINKFGEAVAFMPMPRVRPGDLMYDEAADSMIIDAPSVATETGRAQ